MSGKPSCTGCAGGAAGFSVVPLLLSAPFLRQSDSRFVSPGCLVSLRQLRIIRRLARLPGWRAGRIDNLTKWTTLSLFGSVAQLVRAHPDKGEVGGSTTQTHQYLRY